MLTASSIHCLTQFRPHWSYPVVSIRGASKGSLERRIRGCYVDPAAATCSYASKPLSSLNIVMMQVHIG